MLFRAVSSGLLPAFERNCCVRSYRRAGFPEPLSWIQNSNPPVVPIPGIGGGAIGMTAPVLMSLDPA